MIGGIVWRALGRWSCFFKGAFGLDARRSAVLVSIIGTMDHFLVSL